MVHYRGTRGRRRATAASALLDRTPPDRELVRAHYGRDARCAALTVGTLDAAPTPTSMKQRERIGVRARLFVSVLLCCVAHTRTATASIQVEVNGVDSTLRRNVLALLSLERYKDRDRIEPDAVARLFRRVNDEVSDA